MRVPFLETFAALMLLAAASWVFHEQQEISTTANIQLSESRAREAMQALGYAPTLPAKVSVKNQQVLHWAWERAWFERGVNRTLTPAVVFSWGPQGQVVLRGARVVEIRRAVSAAFGPNLPLIMLEEHVRQRVGGLVPDLASFTLTRLASRKVEGVTWQRAYFSRTGPPLPFGWHEDLMVELAGSTVARLRRTLVPESSDIGVVMGRSAELSRVRWLAFFALGFVVAGLALTSLEELYFRMRLSWLRAAAAGCAVWFLGQKLDHHQAVTLFWGVASALSFLLVWKDFRGGGKSSPWWLVSGVLLGCWSLIWPELVGQLGGWVPATGQIIGGRWLSIAGEAAFRAVSEESLLRGGLFSLVWPFLGRVGAVLLAASVGGLLHLGPAVPLWMAYLGDFFGQLVLGFISWRQGLLAAVLSRLVWELLRLSCFSPFFPWDYFWPCLILLASLGVVWRGYKPLSSLRS